MYLSVLALVFILMLWTLFSKKSLALKLRTPISVLTLLLTLRAGLLQNGFVWQQYDWRLDQDILGWRNDDVVSLVEQHWNLQKPSVEYLVVGSSQVGAIFHQFAHDNERVDVFNMAGMGPLEMNLYIEYILQHKPKNIILYLSEFDLARPPNFNGMKIAPNQGTALFDLTEVVSEAESYNNATNALAHLTMGEVLPEYKYAFVFKGLKAKYFYEKEALRKITVSKTSNNQFLTRQLVSLSKLNAGNVQYNSYLLEKFIGRLSEENIGVYIVEGSYHPEAYSAENMLINARVRVWVDKLIVKQPAITFIQRQHLPVLVAEDYKDGYHLKAESGNAYAASIFDLLGM